MGDRTIADPCHRRSPPSPPLSDNSESPEHELPVEVVLAFHLQGLWSALDRLREEAPCKLAPETERQLQQVMDDLHRSHREMARHVPRSSSRVDQDLRRKSSSTLPGHHYPVPKP